MTLVIPPLLWVVSFERLAAVLQRGWPSFPESAHPFRDSDLAAWVDALLHRLRGPWRHTCLKRSAALFYLLRSARRPVHLRIGVRRGAEGALEAHSWLLLDGDVYLEPRPEVPSGYEVIAAFPDGEGA